MSTPVRTKRGTFAPGTSGNPSGRPKSEHTILRQKLAAHGEEVAAVVVEAALQGDIQAAKIVLERLCPPLKPSTAPVTIELPENPGIADTARAIIEHAAQGQIAPDVAGQLVQSVAALARVVEIDELERRLTALEEKQ
ncbi:hypothetical protein EI168_09665 [Halomonas sp. FME1]|uniref:DUF5681 domain-containing protein n=1 Tax=Halomonas casei TaxID=2742613 RepID=A0ABR9F1N0_9GAMM|nr:MULTISPECIES: DUF5681 domain-containing protein [Halomonas]MBE0400375.1 hypothetical protein [Halomonas casei]PCC20943.1 hypothetical protein CIK78_01990 [Halomonas sp. JB37]